MSLLCSWAGEYESKFALGQVGMRLIIYFCLEVCRRRQLKWVHPPIFPSVERNSSYIFSLIILKLCRSLHNGLKMCMWFGHNRQTIFILFSTYGFSHFSAFQIQ